MILILPKWQYRNKILFDICFYGFLRWMYSRNRFIDYYYYDVRVLCLFVKV